ncbi:MAG: GH3 auxin-responsive promoter family protein [Lachnospiraceae bacterium]|nr:GH3 auxin-responsive promoter family protein [Lachnospiraceae bacterium]
MRFKEKLDQYTKAEIWEEYCGFLDLSMDDYMKIQFRLLKEQLSRFASCSLGQHIMKGQNPVTIGDFLKMIPLTTYEDYQGFLLEKREDTLCGKPVAWLKTTWESGERPDKVAPYTREMLDTYTRNIQAAMILSTSDKKGQFKVYSGAKVLYGLAPMPYATGLFPMLIEPEINLKFMPSVKEAAHLSFSQQNKEGFKQALKSGIDQFFGMSSIVYRITRQFESLMSGGGAGMKKGLGIRPDMLCKIAKAKYLSKRDDRPIRPADIFELDGFVCVGTDTALYKDELEAAWGRRPLEIHGGTETACLATETWSKDGLVFFPDTAFYEFIPKAEMLKNEKDPSYVPRTYLMDEVSANEEYELVVTIFKGGAFMRYRPGDMYRCLRTSNEKDGLKLPQFEYVDRVPSVIDIAGFTRFTERSINRVLEISGLPISDWFAVKEYNEEKSSFMHLYMEVDSTSPRADFLSAEVIRDHMSAYYSQYDHDYSDLKRMLGTDPAIVTVIPEGAIKRYERSCGLEMRRMNPSHADVLNLLNMLGSPFGRGGDIIE